MEQRSEGDPGLPSISIALEAPCTGLGGGPADEGRRGQRFVDASDETISKSAASTKNVIDRLLRLPHRASERVDGRLPTVYSVDAVYRLRPSTPSSGPKGRQFSPQGRGGLRCTLVTDSHSTPQKCVGPSDASIHPSYFCVGPETRASSDL